MHSILALATQLLGLATLTLAQNPVPGGAQAPIASRPVLSPNCVFVGASHAMTFTPGASTNNSFVTSADPELRKFIVYVPSSYQPTSGPYPVVYMLHGTGQTALISMTKTTWNHAAETLGFIAVYPQALAYLLLDGTTKTKWHTDAVADFVVDPSELPMADDVVFLRELHNTLGLHLNIDCERIYASGFSNGGGFVKTKIRVDLPDIFAATTSAGGMGLAEGPASDFFPANGTDFRPHFEIVGTRDSNKQEACVDAGDLNPGDVLPRAIVDVIATPCMWDPLTTLAEAVGMDPGIYVAVEQPTYTQFIWNSTVLPGPGPTEYRFRILPNLTHEYPSGTNYPTDYVPLYYQWMSQYTR